MQVSNATLSPFVEKFGGVGAKRCLDGLMNSIVREHAFSLGRTTAAVEMA